MIYFFIIAVLFFFIYLYDIGIFGIGKIYAITFILMLLVLTAGLSYRVGIDAMRYSEDFVYEPNLFELSTFDFAESKSDPLWIFFSSIFRTMSDNFMYLHLVHAIIINSCIFYFIYKYSTKPFTCITIYFLSFYLFFNFETLRESLAVAVFLFSYKSLRDKKWLKYYTISIIVFFIHSSASFVFFIPLLIRIMQIKNWIPIVLIGGGIFILGRNINEIVLNVLPMLSLNERMLYKLGVYFGRDEIGVSVVVLLKNVVLPITVLAFDKFILKSKSEFTPVTKLFLLLGVVSMVIPVVDRLLNYLIVFYIVHLTNSIFKIADLFELRVVKMNVLLMLIFYFTFGPISWLFTIDDRISEYNYNRYFPYSFYPLNDEYETREMFYKNGS